MHRIVAIIFMFLFGFAENRCYSQNNADSLAHKNTHDTLHKNENAIALTTANESETSDTLLLTDGEVIITTILDSTERLIVYKNPKHTKKANTVYKDEVFSITNKKGVTILYVQDSANNVYTVDEMRYFILGLYDAKKNYKPTHKSAVANLLLSAAAGVTGSFFSPAAPLLFTVLFSSGKIKIDPKTVSNPDYLNDDSYVTGYRQEAHKKQKIKTLIGGGIGLAAGIVTSFILRANGIEITHTY